MEENPRHQDAVDEVKRFHSLPPSGVAWPYLLVNPLNYRELYRREFDLAILDSGVEWFRTNPAARDYPEKFLENWKEKAKLLARQFDGRLWVTIPDYPDDYHPGQGSIEKTVKNIEDFLTVDGVNWLPSIQAKFIIEKGRLRLLKLHLYQAIQQSEKVLGSHPRIAVGSVCKSRHLDDIMFALSAVRHSFQSQQVHAFGLTATGIQKTSPLIDSWDSSAYTFPRGKGRGQATTREQKVSYWFDYLRVIGKALK